MPFSRSNRFDVLKKAAGVGSEPCLLKEKFVTCFTILKKEGGDEIKIWKG
jgi:hypothetical protein